MEKDDTDKSSKTLEPSEKKLRDARLKGDIPASRESGNLAVVISIACIALFTLPIQTPELVETLMQLFEMSTRITIEDGSAGLAQISNVFGHFMISLGQILAPIFLVFVGGAIVGVLIRGETVVALDRISPKLSNMSIASGLSRLFSADAVVEFIKSITKVMVVGALALWVTHTAVSAIWTGPGFLPEALPSYLTQASIKLLLVVSIFLVPLTLIDIVWKRFDWIRKNRMSHKELRDEYKEAEGAPELKAKRMQIRKQLSSTYLASEVPKATLILTNPTRLAIALRYERGSDDAPVCLAKGADYMAHRIRELAFESNIPMVENIPLTRALYEVIDVNDAVPVEHWAIIAEIIGFLFESKQNSNAKLPSNSILVADPN